MPNATFVDPDTWYQGLPTVVLAAGGAITDPRGRILLVKPNYRDHWSLPGGICEFGEEPRAGAAREVAEELGLSLPVGRLLAVDWSLAYGADKRPIMHFLFDGGHLADTSTITPQVEELDDVRFVAAYDLPGYLPPNVHARVSAALHALRTGGTVYVPG